jgi:hypothetical protein
MIETFYPAHIKNVIGAGAANVGKVRRSVSGFQEAVAGAP